MAYPIPSGAIIELTVEGKLAGQTVQNVFHYYYEREGGSLDGGAVVDALMATFAAGGRPLEKLLDTMSAGVAEVLLFGQVIKPVRYAYRTHPGAPETGHLIAEPMPPNVQQSVTLRGEEANRHNLGRKAIAGVPIAVVTNGVLGVLQVGLLQAFADSIPTVIIAPDGGELTPVIYNRQTPELSATIVEGFAQNTVRVERRRTVGLGA